MDLLKLLEIAQAAPTKEIAAGWEIVKGVLITLGAAAAIGSYKMMFGIRDTVRDTRRDLRGEKGDNGIIGEVKKITDRLEKLEAWKIAEDAVTAVEHELMADTGTHPRRLRDKLHSEGERMIPDGYRYKHPKEE